MSEGAKSNVTVNSILKINVASFEQKIVNNKSETLYKINILNIYNNKKWTIEKTYHDIELLNSELSKIIPQVPPFSSFSFFKSSHSYNTIVERKEEIDEYLNECASRKDIMSEKVFYEFILMDKNFPEYIYNSPELIEVIDNSPLSVNEVQYLDRENILFTLMSDCDLMTKIGSFVKNYDILGLSKTDITPQEYSENDLNNPNAISNSKGAFCVYKVSTFKSKKDELKIRLDKIFLKYYKELTGAFYFDKISNIFFNRI